MEVMSTPLYAYISPASEVKLVRWLETFYVSVERGGFGPFRRNATCPDCGSAISVDHLDHQRAITWDVAWRGQSI